MNNDLISRSKLLDSIRNSDDADIEVIEAFLDLQPTVYDVDKVVEEIESLEVVDVEYCSYPDGYNEYIDKFDTLNIVKRGGIDD